MKAVAILKEGASAEIADLPLPEPGSGEIRVQLRAAGVNPADGKMASGAYGQVALPYIPGFDGAGQVDKLGEGVTAFALGERVFGRLGQLGRGTWAEYVVTPESGVLTHIPTCLDFGQAAALPVAGLTALGVLQELGLSAPAGVLVLGATGGVGVFFTQLAARSGLVVVATARPELCETMRKLGATFTVDHTAPWPLEEQLVAAGIEELDAIADFVGDKSLVSSLSRLVRRGGKIISTARGVDEQAFVPPGVSAWAYHGQATKGMLDELVAMAQAGEITIPVDQVADLVKGPQVLEESRSGHLHGKTILKIPWGN